MIPALLANIAGGWGIARIRDSVRPNPYAPKLVDQQAISVAQAARGLRPGTSGLTGSEAEYFSDPQGGGSIGYLPAQQDLTSAPKPPSYFTPGDPGRGDEPTVQRDFFRGPLPNMVAWGETQRAKGQRFSGDRLNPPLFVTPLPQEVVAARAAGAPQGLQDALDDGWSD